jgi:hypothetical protein
MTSDQCWSKVKRMRTIPSPKLLLTLIVVDHSLYTARDIAAGKSRALHSPERILPPWCLLSAERPTGMHQGMLMRLLPWHSRCQTRAPAYVPLALLLPGAAVLGVLLPLRECGHVPSHATRIPNVCLRSCCLAPSNRGQQAGTAHPHEAVAAAARYLRPPPRPRHPAPHSSSR